MKIKVYDKNLQAAGEMELNSKIFEVKPETELVTEAVRAQMANSRTPLGNTKTRGEVRGGGKKPWKQKGTGNARAGSIRSPIWRHGGITFGPRANRNYALKMNKQQWRKALYMVLSDKAATNNFLVFSEFGLEAPKTKQMSALVSGIGEKIAKESKNFLIVTAKKDEHVERAARNLKSVKVVHANSLNILDLLKSDTVLLPKNAVEVIEKTYLKGK